MEQLAHEKPIREFEETIHRFRRQSADNGLLSQGELRKLEQRLDGLKKKVYSELTPWQRVQICRHPQRPKALDYIKALCGDTLDLCGDRGFGDDGAIVGGLGQIDGMRCVIIGTEKGRDTQSRMRHGFGMPSPEGYRKALRMMKLAEKFQLPVVTLVDTPGAACGMGAEERGQGWAIAQNLREMARLSTPIIVLIIGEGCSGGALGVGVGDVVAMLQHSYYSVITPEGCASILWRDAGQKERAAEALKLNSEELLKMEIIDSIIEEPLGGAHHNPAIVYASVKQFLLSQWELLRQVELPFLVEQRYLKFRKMGRFSSIS